MAEVLEPVTFSREIEGSMKDLIVPEEFVKDFRFISDTELIVVIRVRGPDIEKPLNFFEDSEGDKFTIKTIENNGNLLSSEFTLIDMESNEGPYLGVDIDIEPPDVKIVLEFEKK
ncbi:hypothetical protein [Methanobacterium sp.]|uniref:hypothetical protein n=1 Tax=Methanobacterium sp. TaxID=2164 RepID=UPI003C70A076